jgi:hypothetical protein
MSAEELQGHCPLVRGLEFERLSDVGKKGFYIGRTREHEV